MIPIDNMCAFVHVHMYVCVYAVCVCVHGCVCMCLCTCKCMHVCVCTRACMCVCPYSQGHELSLPWTNDLTIGTSSVYNSMALTSVQVNTINSATNRDDRLLITKAYHKHLTKDQCCISCCYSLHSIEWFTSCILLTTFACIAKQPSCVLL